MQSGKVATVKDNREENKNRDERSEKDNEIKRMQNANLYIPRTRSMHK